MCRESPFFPQNPVAKLNVLSISGITEFLLSQRMPLLAYLQVVTRNYHLAEDVFQETFVKALGHAAGFENQEHLGRWFRTTGRNRAIDLIRTREGRYVGLSQQALDALESEWAQQQQSQQDAQVRLSALKSCLEQLSDRNRTLLQMRYFENRSGADIAAFMQRKVESAYQAISRLNIKLIECVQQKLECDT